LGQRKTIHPILNMKTDEKLKYIATRLIDDVYLSMIGNDDVDTFRALERMKLGGHGLDAVAMWVEAEEGK
jgi:hypothetical protein